MTNLDGLFKYIPFEKAYQEYTKHQTKVIGFLKNKADLHGNRPTDMDYQKALDEFNDFILKFSKIELQILLNKASEDPNI